LQAKGARVVDVGMGSAEEFARAGEFGGAVLLVHSDVLKSWDDLFQEYLRAPGIIERAQRGKAAAIAFTATREHDVLYRHINGSGGELMPVPQLLVAREDALRVARLIAAGKQVTADISMPNKAGPAFTTANVVGELRGSERPEEFVILGGHLDSWDLGTGALDNGCNIALVIDTLRAIKASGTRPRRSIRFILFSGEEQGMFGSLAYAQAHRVELDKAVAVVIFDEGVGKVMGFSLGGRKDVAVRLEPLVAPLSRWSADKLTTDAFVGTDNLDFLLEGIPTLVANQEAGNYLVNYHASSDTYDKVDIAQLKNHVAIAAHVVTAIANAREGIGARQSRAEIEALMRETKLDEQMKLFGLWEEWEKGSRGRAR
jgi:Zn-dependent M28 family amino/carboxypeptidase